MSNSYCKYRIEYIIFCWGVFNYNFDWRLKIEKMWKIHMKLWIWMRHTHFIRIAMPWTLWCKKSKSFVSGLWFFEDGICFVISNRISHFVHKLVCICWHNKTDIGIFDYTLLVSSTSGQTNKLTNKQKIVCRHKNFYHFSTFPRIRMVMHNAVARQFQSMKIACTSSSSSSSSKWR